MYKRQGLFQSDEEANNWPQPQFGKAKAGDIKYKDQNGDGIIDAEDETVSYTHLELFFLNSASFQKRVQR